MDNKENPLIGFVPRDKDNGRTPGGGSSEPPSWTLTGKELINQKEKLTSEITNITNEWEKTDISGLPHTLAVNFIDKAKAKSRQKEIISLFVVGENTGQIGFVGENTLLMKIDQKEKLSSIQDELDEFKKNATPISAVSSINNYQPKPKPIKEEQSYKIVPIDYGDRTLNERAIKVIQDSLEKNKVRNQVVNYGNETSVIKIQKPQKDSLKFIKKLPIRSAGPMEKTTFPFRSLKGNKIKADDLIQYDKKETYPLVGLLDSGVDINDLTLGWVTKGKGSNYLDKDINTSHGTYIATLLIHGDELSGTHDSSIRGCKIVDVPVIPKWSIEGDELVGNIEKAIQKNEKVKVWNLSISLDNEAEEDNFSEFAIALDRIQQKYNVIICKSAGNDGKFPQKKQVGKLSVGAEALRTITVGSINRNSDKINYTKKNYRSPYSRIGPGPADIIKPDVVHYGGDIFAKKSNPKTLSDFDQVSDTSSIDGKNMVHKVGTSFSTPKVAKQLAELTLLTDKNYSNLTIKGLAIHSAQYGDELKGIKLAEKLSTIGYGKPKNARQILYDPSFSSTLILEGEVKKGRRIDIMDFPYPQALIRQHQYVGKIKVTLVYDPILASGQGSEYCQSNLEIKFGTYDKKINGTNFMRQYNPVQRSTPSFNTLLKSNYGKNSMHNNLAFANERLLIKYGNKYHPVKKYTFDLSDLKPGKQKDLSDDRKWFLFLEGHYRNFTEYQAVKEQKDLSIPYSLIITIEDPEKKTNVYDSTIAALDNYNFAHSTLSINNNIHLNN